MSIEKARPVSSNNTFRWSQAAGSCSCVRPYAIHLLVERD